MNTILFTIVVQIKNISILLSPIIPLSSEKILNIMNLKNEEKKIKAVSNVDIFNHNLEFKKISILFKKIDDDN
jgi:methionyl-tRNA synthetase